LRSVENCSIFLVSGLEYGVTRSCLGSAEFSLGKRGAFGGSGTIWPFATKAEIAIVLHAMVAEKRHDDATRCPSLLALATFREAFLRQILTRFDEFLRLALPNRVQLGARPLVHQN